MQSLPLLYNYQSFTTDTFNSLPQRLLILYFKVKNEQTSSIKMFANRVVKFIKFNAAYCLNLFLYNKYYSDCN